MKKNKIITLGPREILPKRDRVHLETQIKYPMTIVKDKTKYTRKQKHRGQIDRDYFLCILY